MTGAVLIGSGPSLNQIDLRWLVGRPTITFNRAYLAWSDWPFEPTYHACLDPNLVVQLAGEIRALLGRTRTRFFLHEVATRSGLSAGDRISLVKTSHGEAFDPRLSSLADYGNVGATSLQLLSGMGYDRVLLVGVDARYSSPTDDDQSAIAAGSADPDHFVSGYRSGIAFDVTTDRSVYTEGWPRVARECERHGIAVRSVPGTSLDCFPLCALESGLAWLDEEVCR
jgi:hypothetical protein